MSGIKRDRISILRRLRFSKAYGHGRSVKLQTDATKQVGKEGWNLLFLLTLRRSPLNAQAHRSLKLGYRAGFQPFCTRRPFQNLISLTWAMDPKLRKLHFLLIGVTYFSCFRQCISEAWIRAPVNSQRSCRSIIKIKIKYRFTCSKLNGIGQ